MSMLYYANVMLVTEMGNQNHSYAEAMSYTEPCWKAHSACIVDLIQQPTVFMWDTY